MQQSRNGKSESRIFGKIYWGKWKPRGKDQHLTFIIFLFFSFPSISPWSKKKLQRLYQGVLGRLQPLFSFWLRLESFLFQQKQWQQQRNKFIPIWFHSIFISCTLSSFKCVQLKSSYLETHAHKYFLLTTTVSPTFGVGPLPTRKSCTLFMVWSYNMIRTQPCNNIIRM